MTAGEGEEATGAQKRPPRLAWGVQGRLPGGGEVYAEDWRREGIVQEKGVLTDTRTACAKVRGRGPCKDSCPLLPSTVPPVLEPVEFQNDVAVVRGSSVVLPCEARGSPLPLVSWMKDGEPLLPQSLEQGPSLQLETAGAGDSGTYSCVAVSEAGEARRHFQLTVMGGSSAPPHPPLPRASVSGPRGRRRRWRGR